jgi:hypothetical protein
MGELAENRLRMTTAEEALAITDQAKAWLATTTMWHDAPNWLIAAAVAEFIANGLGLTLYEAHLKK